MSKFSECERKGGHFHRSYRTPVTVRSSKLDEMSSSNGCDHSFDYRPAGLSDSEDDETFDMTFIPSAKQKIEDLGAPNLPIRVVPPVFESCTYEGKAFDKTLDESTQLWFARLQELWKSWKKSQPVENALHSYYSTAPNPYLCGLKLFVNCSDHREAKSNKLPYIIIEELNNWSKPYVNELKQYLTTEIQWIAFTLVKTCKIVNVVKLFNETFCLFEQKDMFLESIKEMLSKKEYKEACQWALCLGLNSHFTYEDFVLPMILQNRQALAEEYLDQNSDMQCKIVEFLDSLLDKNSTVRNSIEPFIRKSAVPDIKYDKLHHKPLSKLIARLCTKYSLSSDICQNLNLKRSEGALHFLLHKRYIEESLNEASWSEMMQEAVGQNEDMQKDLINLMVQYGDPTGALKWAHYYSVPHQFWPLQLKQMDKLDMRDNNECEENWDDDSKIPNSTVHPSSTLPMPVKQDFQHSNGSTSKPKYHQLNLPEDRIILVNTEPIFEEMLRTGFEDVTRVGLDSEWKPYFGTKQSDVALIQLSTGRNVYLLDVVELGHAHYLWKRFSTQVFENHEILKLGFGLRLDLDKIQSTLKLRNSIYNGGIGWLDLQDLTKALGRNSIFRYPYPGEPGCGDGLSALVQLCLGANLDKTNQFSNWELRPLRKEQIIYAALDAHCLLEVHSVITEICANCNINISEVYDRITQYVKSPKKRNKNKSDKKQAFPMSEQPPSPFKWLPGGALSAPPRCVDSVRVVCDSMLEGLSRALRRCGVDAVSIDNSKDHDLCVKIARSQQRVILTRGTAFNRLHQFVPIGYCYRVLSDPVEEQLKEVLEYYNIQVTENNIFSRCQACNSVEFLSFSQSEMSALASSGSNMNIVNFGGPSNQLPVNNRSWQLARATSATKYTKSGALIQAHLIPHTVLRNVAVFYVCQGCGKCYWDGTHFGRVIAGRLKDIVNK